MSTIYRVDVHRDGRWWMIRVPELDGYVDATGARFPDEAITQARRYADINREARDFICSVTDSAPSAVGLDVHVTVDYKDDLISAAANIAKLKARAAEMENEAQAESRRVARQLAGRGVPLRDIGAILDVSYQRADQLVKSD
ncbi:hypothetical protein GOARA_026_00310 [Gordonia araii NBRC 100433]|uniref:HicB-like antitoxin of toxin-antitoxin system domain-containing protein n=1 Tax=Gordonia araii NBRC 100433 TaxID=1073574 RepID=G7GZH6_9ACTN|nr:hypothetical protein [Gordonia araii]NNG97929.1 HicB family toxin-antitoxin system [Gordonia araii NBRC 100433]GAB09001.1 hypothetical protein GOARA_026_00310 [Gordonia araii NBRC 100433]